MRTLLFLLMICVAGICQAQAPSSEAGRQKVLLGVKTNLFYDVVLTPNIEVEVPVGNHWSLNAEYQYGWWLKKHTFCWQIEAGGMEVRCWFGRRPMNGWFVGAFFSGGIYDFQLKKTEGHQGEFFLPGCSGGYIYKVGKHFALEFSAGAGYVITNHTRYRVEDDKWLMKAEPRQRYKSLVPAKLKVSLVWMLYGKGKKGGAR